MTDESKALTTVVTGEIVETGDRPSALEIAGQVANQAASVNLFADYRDRKSAATIASGTAGLEDTWEEKPRTKVKTLPLADRRSSFTEIELGMPEEIAGIEARRCLRCDLEG